MNPDRSGGGSGTTGGSASHSWIWRPMNGPTATSSVSERPSATRSAASTGHMSARRAALRNARCLLPAGLASAARASSSASWRFRSGLLIPRPGARDVPHHQEMRLRWDASPWLIVPVPVLVAPAAALWIAAAAQALGLGRPLDAFVATLAALAGPGSRQLGLLLLVAPPALAFGLAFFGFVGGDVAIADWNVEVHL